MDRRHMFKSYAFKNLTYVPSITLRHLGLFTNIQIFLFYFLQFFTRILKAQNSPHFNLHGCLWLFACFKVSEHGSGDWTLPKTSSIRAPLEQPKLKTGPVWLDFAPETYPLFSWPGYHQSRSEAGKVENRARMTQFCTQNILTLFGTQFLSFPFSTAKECFGWILTTFSGPGTNGGGKVEKLDPDDSIVHPNVPTLFGAQFLLFPISTAEKCFGRILRTFARPGTTEVGKVENRARMTQFSTQNIPTLFGTHFSSVRLKNVSVKFWRLFQA